MGVKVLFSLLKVGAGIQIVTAIRKKATIRNSRVKNYKLVSKVVYYTRMGDVREAQV